MHLCASAQYFFTMNITEQLQHKINNKTKPLGSLGKLEKVARKIGEIQNTLTPEIKKPTILVFAADHGLANEGVSAFPKEVTAQMVLNFLSGGAAINVFCRQNKIDLKVVDAGVDFDFPDNKLLIDAKVKKGTENALEKPSMSAEECIKAISKGKEIVESIFNGGSNTIGFGEMGIGNTSSASLLMHKYTGISIPKCVGRGTGHDEAGLRKKTEILKKVVARHPTVSGALGILATFGGFEIAMIVGAILRAAELNMTILVDGFIVTSAMLAAHNLNNEILDKCVFCHQSEEAGHKLMLEYIQAEPLLNLDMRLGEGSGAAVALPIIQSAVSFLNEMASFEDAGVSNKD